LDEKRLNLLRHPRERALYLVCVCVSTAVAAFFVIGLLLARRTIWESPGILRLYITVASLFAAVFFGMGTTYARTRVFSVALGERQFPELYAVTQDFAARLGLAKTPSLYIKQENGVLNAFAAYFWGRNYVHINTEIFETAYMTHRDVAAVSFIIAHELAHIRLSHTRFWYNASVLFAKFLPVLGPALSRAREYSCDRLALALCPEGKHGIFMLLLGRRLYREVNAGQYLEQAERTRGWFEFAVNLNATHPVNTRRVLAVYKPETVGRLLF
jgi:Zn-dependent protease with chaperone function